MATVTAWPFPNLGHVLVEISGGGDCILLERVIDATGARAIVRPHTWACTAPGEYQHLSGGHATMWDTEAPLDTPFHYEATAVLAGTAAGLHLTGGAGSIASTPDVAALDLVGDVDLRFDGTLDAWVSGVPTVGNDYLVGKYNAAANQRSYVMRLNDGVLEFLWSTDGITPLTRTATDALEPVDGRLAVRAVLDVDNGAAGHTVTFYVAFTIAGPWIQLGDPVVTGGVTSVFSGTADLIVGGIDAGAAGLLPGVVHAAEVRNSVGAVVANPRFDDQAPGTTTFTDEAGRVWTVHGDAFIGGPVAAAVSNTVTLDSLAGGWLRDPARPCHDTRIVTCWETGSDPVCQPGTGVFFASMAAEEYASMNEGLHPHDARRYIPIVRQRRDRGSTLTVVSRTFTDRDDLIELTRPGSPLMFVAPAEFGVPDTYMDVGNVDIGRGVPDHRFSPRLHQLPFGTVDRPVGPPEGVCGARYMDNCETWECLGAVGGLTVPGISGSHAVTPDAAPLDIVGDLDIRADITAYNWGVFQMVLTKYNTPTNNRSYRLLLDTPGVLEFTWSNDGTTVLSAASVAHGFTPGSRHSIRATIDVDNGAAGRTITFYTGPTINGPWTMLGAPVVQGGVTSIHSGTAEMEAGGRDGVSGDVFGGVIHAGQVRDGIDGAIVANPDFAAQATGTTVFVDSAGRTWTVNGAAEITCGEAQTFGGLLDAGMVVGTETYAEVAATYATFALAAAGNTYTDLLAGT